MIGIINYGLGNVQAFYNLYKSIDVNVKIIEHKDQLDKNINKIILPGVGSFDNSITLLDQLGFIDKIVKIVTEYSMPFLGVCVGMQVLANESDEGNLKGLGLIPGKVKKFNFNENQNLMIPHMGWNSVMSNKSSKLLYSLDNCNFYFLHSYYYLCEDKTHENGITSYGNNFTSVIEKDNIFGVQFHPEKSHKFGAQLLKNFSEV